MAAFWRFFNNHAYLFLATNRKGIHSVVHCSSKQAWWCVRFTMLAGLFFFLIFFQPPNCLHTTLASTLLLWLIDTHVLFFYSFFLFLVVAFFPFPWSTSAKFYRIAIISFLKKARLETYQTTFVDRKHKLNIFSSLFTLFYIFLFLSVAAKKSSFKSVRHLCYLHPLFPC